MPRELLHESQVTLLETLWLTWSLLKTLGLVVAFDCLRRAPWPGLTLTRKGQHPKMSTADDTNHGGSKPPTSTPTLAWWTPVFEWAKQQGASTVLLLFGAVGIWRAAPYIVGKFEALSERHAALEQQQREAYTRQLEKAYEVGATRDKATRDEILAEIRRLADRTPAK